MLGLRNDDAIVFLSLIGTTAVILVCAFHSGVRRWAALTEPIGPANYDFSKSPASSITVVGALLGTVISAKDVIPSSTHYMSRAEYAALNLLFGIIVVLAPFVFRAMSRPVSVTNAQGMRDTQFQGFVIGFLLACGLTAWAVVGEVVTLFFLFAELQGSTALLALLWAILAATAVLLIRYLATSVSAVLHDQRDTDVHAQSLKARIGAAGVAVPATVVAPKPQWSLL